MDREQSQNFDKTVAKLLQPFGVLPEHVGHGAKLWGDEPYINVNIKMPTLAESDLWKMADTLCQIKGLSNGHGPGKDMSFHRVEMTRPGEGTIYLLGDANHIYECFSKLSQAEMLIVQAHTRDVIAKGAKGTRIQ